MQNAAWLLGLLAVTACSLDHVLVAALDDASAEPPTTAGSRNDGAAGTVWYVPGGSGGAAAIGTLLPRGGASSETRCSCLDREVQESAGMGAFTWFPVDCVPAAPCNDGVICMTFSNGSFDDTQTACATD